jgi:hypothetical protein
MACIFCGNERVTREHIYRRAWIEWLAPQAESFTGAVADYATHLLQTHA